MDAGLLRGIFTVRDAGAVHRHLLLGLQQPTEGDLRRSGTAAAGVGRQTTPGPGTPVLISPNGRGASVDERILECLGVGPDAGHACRLPLAAAGLTTKRKDKQPEEKSTTGHVWDGDLVELNNPLPRWWLWLFWMTGIYMIVYLVIYPGLGTFAGISGWSQKSQYEARWLTPRNASAMSLRPSPTCRCRNWPAIRMRCGWGEISSSTTAPPATARTVAARRASRT